MGTRLAPLYIFPETEFGPDVQDTSDSMNLFIQGHIESSGSMNLFMHGHTDITGNMPLYITSQASASGNFTLYLKTDTLHSGNSNVSLFTWASSTGVGVTGILDSMTLMVQSDKLPDDITLFIKGPDSAETNDETTLYISGHHLSTTACLNLFMQNVAATGDMSLFIKGKRITSGSTPQTPSDGWIPATGSITLFINRPDESASMKLFIKAIDGESSGTLNMYIGGANIPTGTLNLVMPSTVDVFSENVNLYTHGF